MSLREIEGRLPAGFRFYPTDQDLVCHYLYTKINLLNHRQVHTFVQVDLHTCEPWQLPEEARLNSNEWYFFSFRDRKYATGSRANRATTTGYWKATGKDKPVLDPTGHSTAGMRKTLVFYKNRAPNGIKTGWIMHEYRLHNPNSVPKDDWVLCRVFDKFEKTNIQEEVYHGLKCDNKTNIFQQTVQYGLSLSSIPSNSLDVSVLNSENPEFLKPPHPYIAMKGGDEPSTGVGADKSIENESEFMLEMGFDYSPIGEMLL